jgi:hypothetical protein
VTGPERPHPFTEEGASSALAALGLDPDDVADELAQMGHRGVPGSDCYCPIAHYLAAVVQRCRSVGVYLDDALGREDEAHAELSGADDDGAAMDIEVPLTAAVIVFIRRFDTGRKYTELIEKTEEVNVDAESAP